MKHIKRFFFKTFLLTVCLFYSEVIYAYDFWVDGVYYNILSDNEVEVTSSGSINKPTGTLKIPETVKYNGIVYKVTTIGERAYQGSSGLKGSLIIPKSVTTIKELAFYGCSGFASLEIPNSVISIKRAAFAGCTGFAGTLTIPNSVTSIEEMAFRNCNGFTGLVIPNSITSIGSWVFEGCSGFTGTLTIPNSVTSIGEYAFAGCYGFTGKLIIPNSVISIGRRAFGSTGFTGTLSIPNTVTSVGEGAFSGCSGFTSLELPNSINTIEENTFYGCSGLTSLEIPNSIKSIKKMAFSGCTGLSGTLIIPTSITTIEPAVFGGCSNITSLRIHNSITEINDYAFSGCKKLSLVISEIITPFDIGEGVFNGISSNAKLQVPKGTRSRYVYYGSWRNSFKEIVEEKGSYTITIQSSGSGSVFYNGTTIRNRAISFTIDEGTSVTLTFAPDNGYRIKSAKVNNSTISVSNNQYTISSINANTTVSVEFEAIPVTTYTLSITASGNGSASYDGTTIRSKTSSFTVNEGTSATITFTPDNGYRIKSVKVNNIAVSVSNNQYTISSINANTTVSVEFEAIPVTTYTLSITASGKGYASYGGTTIQNNTSSFTINAGSSATITFTPEYGYRIKSVKVNNVVVSVSNNQYTISNISSNTSVSVEFEVITYTLSITSTGGGVVYYNNNSIRNSTETFTLSRATNATISFYPDNDYRIKTVKVNNSTVSFSDNQYTISNINANTTVSVEFEAIPVTTYTLSITASGNGSASYGGTTIRSKTSSFTVNQGSSATITFTPDNGYRIKNVKVNNSTVTVSNNQYTISSISANTTVSVEFETIPVTTYTLSITASGNGSASYGGTTIRSKTSSFTVNEESSATITFTPDNGYRIKSVKVNNSDVTVSNNEYTISNITKNTYVEVEFEEMLYEFTTIEIDGIYYNLLGETKQAEVISNPNGYINNIVIPESIKYEGTVFSVTTIGDNAFSSCSGLISITIPSSVTSIGFSAFSNCSGLTSIDISNSVTSIGDGAFSNCSGLTSITIPNSLTSIGDYAFSGCSGLTLISVSGGNTKYDSRDNCNAIIKKSTNTIIAGCKNTVIPNSVTSIGNRAFYGCSGLTSITIPNSVMGIGHFAFSDCSGLISITIPNSVTSIGDGVFCDCSGLTSISVSDGNTKYDSRDNCNAIIKKSTNTLIAGCKNTVIPNSVTSIGDWAYYGCSGLTSITIPNSVTSIGDAAFRDCTGLTSITIPKSVTNIGNSTFYGCSGLTSITIPNSVSYISYYAFYGCSVLTQVRSYIYPPFAIDESVFKGISSSAILEVPKGTKSRYQALTGWADYFKEIVEFDDSPTTYTLSITASGNGTASYNSTTIRSKTSSFTVNEGTSATITFTPDDGYQIKDVKVNGSIVSISNSQYTISSIYKNTTLEVDFEETLKSFSSQDLNYTVVSGSEHTIRLAKGNYDLVLEVPEKVNYQDVEWTVTGIDNGALANNTDLAAIIWSPEAAFTEQISNPNLLLYVNKAQYAPSGIQNVVVNGTAQSIILKDATSGNNFHCPQEFTAQRISYTHNYSMETGIGEAKGWETIALPFDVQKVTHESKGEIVSFANWKSGDSKRPFWLMQLSGSGWTLAESIKANTPYIISMPKNDEYKVGFWLNGNVTFSAENVSIPKTADLKTANYGNRTFVPTFVIKEKSNEVLALNVKNDIENNTNGYTAGSTFVYNLRPVHPFEAYMTTTAFVRSVGIDEGMATSIIELIWALSDDGRLRIYNLNGQLIKAEEGRSQDEVIKDLPAGVYIVNGKKLIIK